MTIRPAALVFVMACGSPTQQTPPVVGGENAHGAAETEAASTPSEEGPPPAAGSPHGGLVIAAFSLVTPDGVIDVQADGTVTMGAERARIDARGFHSPDGSLLGSIDADGSVQTGGVSVARIVNKQILIDGGPPLAFDAEGNLLRGSVPTGVQLSPADTPAKTAALLLVVVLMI